MNIFKIMLVSLFCTLVIEMGIARLILKIRDKYDMLNIFLVNVLTNPLVVSISFFINIRYGLFARHGAMIFLELFAFFIEGFIYNKYLEYDKLNGFLISFILNSSSFLLGCLINSIIW